MLLTYQPYDLALRYPFRIALMSRTSTPIVLVQIKSGAFTGFGEASMPPYLGESPASVCAFLDLANRKIFKHLSFHTSQIIDIQQLRPSAA